MSVFAVSTIKNSSDMSSTVVDQVEWVSVNGAQLFSRRFGNQGPALFVMNGGPGFSHDYLLALKALGTNCRVIFFDPRGCGQSTGIIDDSTMNMQTFIEDFDAVRKAHKIEKFTVVGHSSGGLMAMYCTIQNRHLVERMILLNSMDAKYVHAPQPKQDYIAGIRAIKASSGFHEGRMDEIVQSYKNFFRDAFYYPHNLEKLDLGLSSLRAAKNSILVREAFERTLFEPSFDYQDQLRELHIPTLIIHAANDFIPRTVAENLQHVLTGSELVDIPNCGHFSVTEHPDLVNSSISSFMMKK